MATDGVTDLDVAHVPDKTADDVITGNWAFTKALGTAGGLNFIRNSSLEIWLAGTSVAPTGWTLTGSGATVARDSTNKKVGTYSAAITRVGNDCYLSQNLVTLFGPVEWWQGKRVTFGTWVRASLSSRARLHINDGTATSSSNYHSGGSGWEFITVTRDISGSATQVEVRLAVDSGNTTAQFDGAILVLGGGIQEFVPGLLDFASLDVAQTVPTPWAFTFPVGNVGGVSWTYNSNFEIWGAGTAAAPTGWTLSGAGASVARNTSNQKIGNACAAVTRSGTNCYITQNAAAISEWGPIARFQGKTVAFGCWVRASVASAARLTIADGVGTSTSSTHTGGGTYEWLQVSRTIDAAATVLEIRCEVIVDTTVQFDGPTLVFGTSVQDFIPSSWRRVLGTGMVASAAAIAVTTTGHFIGPGGAATTEVNVSWRAPHKCVIRRLYADASANVTTQDVIVTLRTGESVETSLTLTVSVGTRTNSNLTNEVEVASGTLLSIGFKTGAGTAGSVFWKAMFEIEVIP